MNDEMLDCLRGLLDEIDRCGVKVSPKLDAKVRKIVGKNEAVAKLLTPEAMAHAASSHINWKKAYKAVAKARSRAKRILGAQ